MMQYLTAILAENDNVMRYRAHASEDAARDYVENLAGRFNRLCVAGVTDLWIICADVYLILPSGHLRQVGRFEGEEDDDGDGIWRGWVQ